MKKILILKSNFRNDLNQIDREIRDLTKAIERNKNSGQFDVKLEVAVNIENLDELLYDNQPYIVHFCGHGAGKQGLVLENQEGVKQLLPNEALSNLFRNCGREIECVLLNACNTEIQADIIVEHIPYVIGTSGEILDKAAYYFSVGFYKGLVREQSIEVSYAWGYTSVQLNMPNVKIVSYIAEEFRRLEPIIEEDGSNVASEPFKIILKRKTVNKPPATKLSVNIPPEVEKEIIEEGNRKKYYDNLRDVLARFGQTTIEREKPISKFEYEQRQTFFNKVHDFWIDGFLKPSFYFNTAADKDRDDPSGQILRPLTNLEVIRVDIDESYDELQQTDIMEQIGGGKTLLILGEPGSGKTIALLQLAEQLIRDLRKNKIPTKPIPVVFNLSSWGQKQQPLEKWLIQELQEKYQVPQYLSTDWIKQEQLILLLDGLDEVGAKLDKEKATKQRDACVKAINRFIATHLKTEIVVCSRVKDYEALTEKLLLNSAICIQPLSKQQLLEFLKNADDSLSGLKTAIEQDQEMAEFTQTPLILNMMTLTYHGWSAEKCRMQFRTAKNRLDNLFDLYIDKNLAQENKEEKYPKKKVLHLLSWLAKQMSQSVFQIEEIQPQWLPSENKIIYHIVIGLILGVLLGLIAGIYFVYYYTVSQENKPIPEINILIELIAIGMLSGLIPGVIVGLLFLRSNRVIKWLISGTIFAISISFFDFFIYEQQIGILPIFMSALLGGAIFSSIDTEIKPVESIELDLNKLFNYATWFGIAGIVYALIHLYLEEFNPKNGYQYSVYEIIIFIMVGVFIGGFKLQNRINPERAIPNQGIKKSLKYTVITFWSLLFAAMFVGWVIDFSFHFNPVLICIGLVIGLLGGLGANESSGVVCIQHFALRQMLHQKGLIPSNYAKFLNFASDRLLMKKVGGGYVFFHRMLLEYFARMIEG